MLDQIMQMMQQQMGGPQGQNQIQELAQYGLAGHVTPDQFGQPQGPQMTDAQLKMQQFLEEQKKRMQANQTSPLAQGPSGGYLFR